MYFLMLSSAAVETLRPLPLNVIDSVGKMMGKFVLVRMNLDGVVNATLK